MSESARKMSPAEPSRDALLISAFLNGAAHVLQVQAATSARAADPFYRAKTTPPFGDIAGIIDLDSDIFKGSFVIAFPTATYLAIMSKMLGETFTNLTPDLRDGAGELTNIIFGEAKVTLNQRGDNLKMARPQVIIGANEMISNVISIEKSLCVVVPFTSDSGPFQIEIQKKI